MRPTTVEKIQYITPDGVVYDLHDPPDRFVLHYEGDGFAPMDFGTTSGPYQHGETVTEVRLRPRTIDMVVRQNGCDRDAYWAIRSLMNGILRPNRVDMNAPEPGVLRRVLSNGNIRDLDCFVSKGPVYTRSVDGWDEFSIHENLRFTGFNPVMYDPELLTDSVSDFLGIPVSVSNIIFPFSFPFVFGTDYTVVTKVLNINYLGDWEEYPTIDITGPATNFEIRHQTLGDKISFEGYEIAAGQVVTIDLNYSRKTVVDNSGVSWLGKVSDDSSLTSFRIEPDPVVPGGANAFEVSCILGDTNTRVDFYYKNRYVGI
jgi:hypothetical protein